MSTVDTKEPPTLEQSLEEPPAAPLAELQRPAGSRSSDEQIYDEYGLTSGQFAILLKTVCAGAPREMAGFFLIYCRRNNLDPFARDVYLMKTMVYDKDVKTYVPRWQIVSGIAGLRKIASRSPLYQGQTAPEWFWAKQKVTTRNQHGEERTEWEVILDDEGMPAKPVRCRVGVYRKGCKEPFWGDVLYREFVQTTKDGALVGQWKTSPTNQLSVRAEAQALRKGFPEEVGGLYLEEELRDATDEQLSDIHRAQNEAGTVIERDEVDDQIDAALTELGWKRARIEVERRKFPVKQSFLAHLQAEIDSSKAPRGQTVAQPAGAPEATASRGGDGATVPAPSEVLMTEKQQAKIFAVLGQLGVKAKKDRLAFAERHGVVVESYTQLTDVQANTLIDAAEAEVAALGREATRNDSNEPCPACLTLPGDLHYGGCPES